jgi:hypothetical protein
MKADNGGAIWLAISGQYIREFMVGLYGWRSVVNISESAVAIFLCLQSTLRVIRLPEESFMHYYSRPFIMWGLSYLVLYAFSQSHHYYYVPSSGARLPTWASKLIAPMQNISNISISKIDVTLKINIRECSGHLPLSAIHFKSY